MHPCLVESQFHASQEAQIGGSPNLLSFCSLGFRVDRVEGEYIIIYRVDNRVHRLCTPNLVYNGWMRVLLDGCTTKGQNTLVDVVYS